RGVQRQPRRGPLGGRRLRLGTSAALGGGRRADEQLALVGGAALRRRLGRRGGRNRRATRLDEVEGAGRLVDFRGGRALLAPAAGLGVGKPCAEQVGQAPVARSRREEVVDGDIGGARQRIDLRADRRPRPGAALALALLRGL